MSGDSEDDRTLHMITAHAHYDDRIGGQWVPWTDAQHDCIGWKWSGPESIGHVYVYMVYEGDSIVMYFGPHGDPHLDAVVKGVEP